MYAPLALREEASTELLETGETRNPKLGGHSARMISSALFPKRVGRISFGNKLEDIIGFGTPQNLMVGQAIL